jgi:ceramide glucosyltransferase
MAVVAAGYQMTAFAAALRQLWAKPTGKGDGLGVSVLKPVRGLDPDFEEAIRSYAEQEYSGPFELIFGAADEDEPSRPVVEKLMREYPHLDIQWVKTSGSAPNAKVAVLEEIGAKAKYPLWLVSDSDIIVPPGYLERVAAPLAERQVGLVTTLYRARGEAWPAKWEALGIAIDFAPSVLVAPLVGIREFGLGATLVFRAEDLERIGGFGSIRDYLADDYQLAKKITGLGLEARMSEVVVETSIGDDSWAGVWRHQVRWARTIRVSRGDGYLGLPITHAGVWICLAALCGAVPAALLALGARYLSAVATGVVVLQSPLARVGWVLAPLWDLWAFAVWIAGLRGSTVIWRDGILRLTKDGRLLRSE